MCMICRLQFQPGHSRVVVGHLPICSYNSPVVLSSTSFFEILYLHPLHSNHKTDKVRKSSISPGVNRLPWANKISAASAGMWNVTVTQPFSMLRSCNVDAFSPKIFATAACSLETLASLLVSSMSNLKVIFADPVLCFSKAG